MPLDLCAEGLLRGILEIYEESSLEGVSDTYLSNMRNTSLLETIRGMLSHDGNVMIDEENFDHQIGQIVGHKPPGKRARRPAPATHPRQCGVLPEDCDYSAAQAGHGRPVQAGHSS